MNDKLVHLEFMKAALTGFSTGLWGKNVEKDIPQTIVNVAVCIANAALIEYQKRWEREEESQCRCDKKKLAPMPEEISPIIMGNL